MTDLVNIVHPFTFKVKDHSLIYGPIKEYEGRDRKVVDFVRTALDLGVRILRYDSQPQNTFSLMLENGAISSCPTYNGIIFDEQIKGLSLPHNAAPILDDKPENIGAKDWEQLRELVTPHSKLKYMIGNPDRTFYIGGYLEYCLVTTAAYQRRNYTPEGEIFCVEDLCPVHSPEKVEEAKRIFEEADIILINSEEAMKLLKENHNP